MNYTLLFAFVYWCVGRSACEKNLLEARSAFRSELKGPGFKMMMKVVRFEPGKYKSGKWR
jgi:hypothetical protein